MFYKKPQEWGKRATIIKNVKRQKRAHTLTHKSSCRFAEPIADAEWFRVGGRERLHLLGRFAIGTPRKSERKVKIAVNLPTRIIIPLRDAAGFF